MKPDDGIGADRATRPLEGSAAPVAACRKRRYFRDAVSLGTGLTALFLLVRCSVPERDYTPLGIGENVGSGGGGSGGDGTGGTSAGAGGSSGSGGTSDLGGQGGEGPVFVPIPCDEAKDDAGTDNVAADAGLGDAGTADAGSTTTGTTDAGAEDAVCECVDGFIRAVDADGDGEGTRACSVAPGLDCDDGDEAVTHNGCGGCTELPNAVGEDCLDCGAYICKGPDGVSCASKPDAVVIDSDCRCLDGQIAARDTDGDGEGTRLCEESPGEDCDDGDNAFVNNGCGGCQSLNGTIGASCGQCGVYTCSGTNGLDCAPPTGAAGRRCSGPTQPQTCVGSGFWQDEAPCANVCHQGNCELCVPGTFQCFDLGGGSTQVLLCGPDSSTSTIGWGAYDSCLPGQTCNPADGTCTGSLMWPRDHTFDVVPLRAPGGLKWHDVLNSANDSDYG